MDKEKKITVLAVVILIIFSLLAVAYFVLYENGSEIDNNKNSENDNSNSGNNTAGYKTVSVSEAYDLINQSNNNETDLTIVDCRGYDEHVSCSDCTFKAGHIPGAERSINPKAYENTTYDILIYGASGNESEKFCNDLVNTIDNVDGTIYNLEGGWAAWLSHYYKYNWPPIEKGLTD